MKVWLVGTNDVESTCVQHVCLSEKTALKRWNELRQELIDVCRSQIDTMRDPNYKCRLGYSGDSRAIELYEREIKNLSETDPKKLENYPHEEPFISEMETEE